MEVLPREEYIEQAYLFKALHNRTAINEPVQEMLAQIREEVLSTTKLPMAIDFMLAEVRHVGTMSTAMKKLPHYFTQFQIFIIEQAEDEHGRFDMRVAFLILEAESKFRADNSDPVAMFFYQMETLCRNRLDYDFGLSAIAMDPVFDGQWQRWILEVRHQLGLVELADLIYVNSQYYVIKNPVSEDDEEADRVILFGEKKNPTICSLRCSGSWDTRRCLDQRRLIQRLICCRSSPSWWNGWRCGLSCSKTNNVKAALI